MLIATEGSDVDAVYPALGAVGNRLTALGGLLGSLLAWRICTSEPAATVPVTRSRAHGLPIEGCASMMKSPAVNAALLAVLPTMTTGVEVGESIVSADGVAANDDVLYMNVMLSDAVAPPSAMAIGMAGMAASAPA